MGDPHMPLHVAQRRPSQRRRLEQVRALLLLSVVFPCGEIWRGNFTDSEKFE